MVLCVGEVADAQALVPGMGRGLECVVRIGAHPGWMQMNVVVSGGRLGPLKRSSVVCLAIWLARVWRCSTQFVAHGHAAQPGRRDSSDAAAVCLPITRPYAVASKAPRASPCTRRAKIAYANCAQIAGQPRSRASNQAARRPIRERLVQSRLAAVRLSVREGTQARRKVPHPRVHHHTHKRQLDPATTPYPHSIPCRRLESMCNVIQGSSPCPGICPRRAALAVQLLLQWGAKADAVLHLNRAVLLCWGPKSRNDPGHAGRGRLVGWWGTSKARYSLDECVAQMEKGAAIRQRVLLPSAYAPLETERPVRRIIVVRVARYAVDQKAVKSTYTCRGSTLGLGAAAAVK